MSAQEFEVEWEHVYCDGANYEFVLTPDGGIIAVTSAYSGIGCEKTEFGYGVEDIWVVKMDAAYNVEWENTIGGSGSDKPTSINLTSDGGYIIGATSSSPISGDKTEPTQDLTAPYSTDIWIIKLDVSGNIQWQNTIGGNAAETYVYIEQITGGGYILSATSKSGISGDKMENTVGGTGWEDYWIMKLNSTGSIVWQNTIGGDATDIVTAIHQIPGGGFIVCGNSNSEISGDKTEGTAGPSTNYDNWILKLNNAGNIQWQNSYGATYFDGAVDILPMDDGGFIVGSTAESYYDAGSFQIAKLNASGNLQWTSNLGCGGENLISISKTADGGFILGGRSNSYTCASKTDAGPPNTYGWDGYDAWVVKADALGNAMWDNALGGSGDDGSAMIKERPDGSFLLAAYVGYDDGTWDKSAEEGGAWLAILNDSLCFAAPEICNGLDDDCDFIVDEDIVESITVSALGATDFCSGNSVDLIANVYTGPYLQWKKNGEDIPGATAATYTATSKGIYTCETSSDCSFAISEWIEVNVFKKPNATISAGGPTTFCAGGNVMLTATAGGGQSYQWYKNGNVIAGATSLNYTATDAGNYQCLVTKISSGCSKQSNTIAVAVPCKDGEIVQSEITIFPNPATTTLTIFTNSTASKTIQIVDLVGQIVLTTINNSNSIDLNIAAIPAGIYFVTVQQGQTLFIQKKIIKQ